jgi:uncharacterized membrane protein
LDLFLSSIILGKDEITVVSARSKKNSRNEIAQKYTTIGQSGTVNILLVRDCTVQVAMVGFERVSSSRSTSGFCLWFVLQIVKSEFGVFASQKYYCFFFFIFWRRTFM